MSFDRLLLYLHILSVIVWMGAGLTLVLLAARARQVGEARNRQEAIASTASLQPDVILMDIKMSDMDGIRAARKIVRTSPHIPVLILTMLEDGNSVFTAMRAAHMAMY